MPRLTWKRVGTFFLIAALDAIILSATMLAALVIRFDFSFISITAEFFSNFVSYLPVRIAVAIATFLIFKTYNIIWRYISISDIVRIITSVIVMECTNCIVSELLGMHMPKLVYLLVLIFDLLFITFLRVSYRAYWMIRNYLLRKNDDFLNTMIIGAGDTGRMVINWFATKPSMKSRARCVIDDNQFKIGTYLEGVPVVGNVESIPANVAKYNIKQIIFAIPTAEPERQSYILDICNDMGCTLKIIPLITDVVNGELQSGAMRDVQVEDLLGREPIRLNNEKVFDFIRGKTVMVTGGGGSIGSELCRQIAAHRPASLIVLDIYENNAYAIEQELKRKHPELNLPVIIASVRDVARLEQIFDIYRPQIVFHAAAHKHVPLMESSPNEAIKNNVFGTYNTAQAAIKYGVEKFVLISTDKAVNPTNIMGASKRLCEMVIQTADKQSETDFVAVRFGNVLGSNGSVIPLFKEQIKNGGPVLVTHPDIIRYFMTIPEAVSLILQAGAFAKGGEIFVLDMGKPVKIDDLARNLIRLSGFVPDVDIEVKYTGLRPGEKLYEELLMNEEGLKKTDNKLIFIGEPININPEEFEKDLQDLKRACESNSPNIKDLVASVVPTYKVDRTFN